jgi:hypothetical protein
MLTIVLATAGMPIIVLATTGILTIVLTSAGTPTEQKCLKLYGSQQLMSGLKICEKLFRTAKIKNVLKRQQQKVKIFLSLSDGFQSVRLLSDYWKCNVASLIVEAQ